MLVYKHYTSTIWTLILLFKYISEVKSSSSSFAFLKDKEFAKNGFYIYGKIHERKTSFKHGIF